MSGQVDKLQNSDTVPYTRLVCSKNPIAERRVLLVRTTKDHIEWLILALSHEGLRCKHDSGNYSLCEANHSLMSRPSWNSVRESRSGSGIFLSKHGS